jgi:hypothetical protein
LKKIHALHIPAEGQTSLPPELLKPGRRQLGVVAELGLQSAGVVAGIGKRITAGVTQHVKVRLEVEPGGSPARWIILAKPALKGAPRPETNRNGPPGLSRCAEGP